MKKCSKCSSDMPDNAVFCQSCGNPFPAITPQKKNSFCAYCGKPLLENARFCVACGKAQPQISDPVPVQSTVSQPVEKQVAINPKEAFWSKRTLLTSTISAVMLIMIQLISFKFEGDYVMKHSYVKQDITSSRFWFAGLIIGTIMLIVAIVFAIICMAKRYKNVMVTISLVLIVIALVLVLFSVLDIETRVKSYEELIEIRHDRGL